MKQLIFILVLFALSCSKPTITPVEQDQNVYYRIQQVDIDGTITYSPVRHAVVSTSSAVNDDGDEDDDDGCHPLAIIFETFTATVVDNHTIKINWQAVDEKNVDHYIVEKSLDSKTWTIKTTLAPNSTGIYMVTDKF
jgi:hypothetical protein